MLDIQFPGFIGYYLLSRICSVWLIIYALLLICLLFEAHIHPCFLSYLIVKTYFDDLISSVITFNTLFSYFTLDCSLVAPSDHNHFQISIHSFLTLDCSLVSPSEFMYVCYSFYRFTF